MFNEIYNDVKNYLEVHNANSDDRGFTFRKRSDHMWRVFIWVNRLIEDCTENINKEALLIAALFHDMGRYISHCDHANQSAFLFHDYAVSKNYDVSRTEFIEYLIRNHDNKELLLSAETPLELIYLIESDMLDETGALFIVWMCMSYGFLPDKTYIDTYKLLLSCKETDLSYNPMKTIKARKIWEDKQKLITDFIKQLEYDLAINE